MWRNLLIVFDRNFAVAILILSLTYSTGCTNALSSFADKDDNLSLNYKVREYIRKERYTDAIDTCSIMSDDYAAEPAVIELCATAYAGRCGFKLLTQVSNVETYIDTAPAEKLFHWLMTQYATASAQHMTDCNTAHTMIRSLGAASVRTADQNALMALLSFQTIATVLKVAGDADNDEILDPAFKADACAGLSAAQAQVIGAAFWDLDKSLDALSTNTFYTNLDTAVDLVCSALDVLVGGDGTQDTVNDNGLCYATSPLALNADRLNNARSIIAEGSELGVDQTGCGGGTIVDPGCFCP